MFRNYLFALIVGLPLLSLAQGEANMWYFGNQAGVNFNTSPPTALTDGQLSTSEGCSSMSDENGNLLFYTDGRTVWNRNHEIMSNADYFGGNGLLGDPSSTSSGLIVPNPINPDIYYVFTVDEPHHENAFAYPDQGPAYPNGNPIPDGEYTDVPGSSIPQDDDGYNNGLNYSAVDMSLNNGLGNVVDAEKNRPLITYDATDSEELKYKCSEKITAVKAHNCNAIWVLTHFIDKFYAFKIDENGVNAIPVISQVGPSISITDYRRAALGYMKASPDGKKILVAHQTRTFDQVGTNEGSDGGVFLYDFDDETGEVSNNQALIEDVNPYGVEFSTETTKAYATMRQQEQVKLYQWDLESDDIPSSKTELSSQPGVNPTALQLAPNGKIYRALIGTSKLGVINQPELTGIAAEYSESTANGAISLGNREVLFGLPPFIQSIFTSRINIVDDMENPITTELDLCNGDTYTLSYDDFPNGTYTWYKDGEILQNENSSELPIAQPPDADLPYSETYRLNFDKNDGSCPFKGIAKVTYYPLPEAQDFTLTQCSYGDDAFAVFDLTTANDAVTNGENASMPLEITYYESLEDAQNETNEIADPEAYQSSGETSFVIARVENSEAGCVAFAQVELDINQNSFEPIDLHVCATGNSGFEQFDLDEARTQIQQNLPEVSVIFYVTKNDAINQENPIENESAFENTTAFSSTVYARLGGEASCAGIIAVQLEVDPLVPIGDDKTRVYCLEDFPKKLNLGSGIPETEQSNFTYLWGSGETTESLQTNTIGGHSVTVTNKTTDCSATRNFTIEASNKASFHIKVEDFSANNSLEVILEDASKGDYLYALDDENGSYQASPIFENVPPGEHRIFARDLNGCGTSSKSVAVLGVMKFFTPNNDGTNDRWELLGKNAFSNSDTKISIFDRFGKLLASFPGDSSWSGKYHGRSMPSDDYWYKIRLKDGRTFTGNFTLKR